MKKTSVTFVFDFPLQISQYSIFDVGSDKDYIDWDRSKNEFSEVYQEEFQPELEALCTLCTDQKSSVSAFLSGVFIELLQQTDLEMINRLKDASKEGLELLGGTYANSLTSIYSLVQLEEEVIRHKSLLKKVFGVSPKHFYNCENIYFSQLANVLESLGFKSSFAGAIDWYLGDNKHDRIFHSADSKKFKVHLVEADAGNSFFNNKEQEIHNLQFDLGMIKQFAGVRSIVRVIQRKAELMTLKTLAGTVKQTKPYRIKSPVIGSIHGRSLDNYIGQGMQSSIFNLYYDVNWKKLVKDEALTHQYLLLGQAIGFTQLAVNHHDNEKSSPYELYSQLINILSDLKIKVG